MSKRYARCRRCNVMQLINKSGVFRKHDKTLVNGLGNHLRKHCQGSGQNPKDVQTFLEEKRDMIP